MKVITGMVAALLLANAIWTRDAEAARPTVAGKKADQIYASSSTTPQSDKDLILHLSGNGTDIWFVEYYLFINTANTTMDFKAALSVGTTGATGDLWALNHGGANFPGFGFQGLTAAPPLNPGVLTAAIAVGSKSGLWGLSIAARIFDTGAAGDVVLQCAQNTADGGAITVTKGSFMRATRMQDMVFKNVDQIYASSSATLQLDNDLKLLMTGNGTDIWFLEYYMFINTANTTMDFQSAMLLPTASNKKGNAWLLNYSAAATPPNFGPLTNTASPGVIVNGPGAGLNAGSASGLWGNTIGGRIFDVGSMNVGSNVVLECAQQTANAGAITLKRGSFMRATGRRTPGCVFKTVDQTYNANSVLLQADNDLKLPLSGNGKDVWFVEYYLFINTANGAMDFQTALDVGATGASGDLWGLNVGGTDFPNFGAQLTSVSTTFPPSPGGLGNAIVVGSSTCTTTPVNGIAPSWGLSIAARIFDGGTAGNVVLQCAQNTSGPGLITVQAGSFMRATKVLGALGSIYVTK